MLRLLSRGEKGKGAEKWAKDEIATQREVLSCVGGVWEVE